MSDYVNVTELFGCDVFNDAVMEERLPKKVYKELKKTIEEGKELSLEEMCIRDRLCTGSLYICRQSVSLFL